MEELRLVKQAGVVANVLEEICVFYHFLEGLHFQNFVDFSLHVSVIPEVWLCNDSVHEVFDKLLVFLPVAF